MLKASDGSALIGTDVPYFVPTVQRLATACEVGAKLSGGASDRVGGRPLNTRVPVHFAPAGCEKDAEGPANMDLGLVTTCRHLREHFLDAPAAQKTPIVVMNAVWGN